MRRRTHGLAAHSAGRRGACLLARLTGDLGGPSVNVQVSLSEHPRWQQAMQVITAALEPHPEAKLAVVQALLQADAAEVK